MGYCPYICILCGDVEDNGWLNAEIWKLDDLLPPGFERYGGSTPKEDEMDDICFDCMKILFNGGGLSAISMMIERRYASAE